MNAKIIKIGIIIIRVLSLFTKIFSIAGSKSQAIEAVLAAKIIEKKTDKKIFFKCFFV